MLYSDGPRSAEFMKQVWLKEQTYCVLTSTIFTEYEQCIGGFHIKLDEDSFCVLWVKYFLPQWEYMVNE